jgi:hypothetical protein
VLSAGACSDAREDVADDEVTTSEDAIITVARDATNVTLHTNAAGTLAHLGFTSADGHAKHVLAWGAVNAKLPARGSSDVEFKLDFLGGGAPGTPWPAGHYKSVTTCLPYTGPALRLLVKACDAADGSHWAIQSWRRLLPNGAKAPAGNRGASELHLSHWKGELPKLEVYPSWTPNHLDRVFGRLTYLGHPLHGFSSTRVGDPKDSWGRNIYVDTHEPAWPSDAFGQDGWYRYNSGLTHDPAGNYCIGMYPLYGRPDAEGDKYRLTVLGPGVMPILREDIASPGAFDASRQQAAKAIERAFTPASDSCF